MFEGIIAPNPNLNATRFVANMMVDQLAAKGYSNVGIFANQINGGGAAYMIPDAPNQKIGDAPFVDQNQNMQDMGVPMSLPVYIQLWVPKLQNYFCAGSMIREMALYHVPIEDTLK